MDGSVYFVWEEFQQLVRYFVPTCRFVVGCEAQAFLEKLVVGNMREEIMLGGAGIGICVQIK